MKQRNFVRQAFEMPEAPLDAVDRRIVAELQAAPRLRVAELARRIGLSGPAAADRLRRLEDELMAVQEAQVASTDRHQAGQAAAAALLNAAAERIESVTKKLNATVTACGVALG